MPALSHKYLRELAKLARQFGRHIEITGGSHVALICDRGERHKIIAAFSPRNARHIMVRLESDLRKADKPLTKA